MKLKLCLLAIMSVLAACDPVPKETLRLDMETVRVDQQREASGDRPYLNTIFFQSRFNTSGSTDVNLRSREPNDWVSKTQYNGGLLPDGHMDNGDVLTIPWWMGEHEWRMKVIDLLDLLEDNQPEVAGAIVYSFDNNNTPPHVIRDMLTDITNIMRGIMNSQISEGNWINSLTDPLGFFEELLNRVTGEVSLADLGGYFFQLTVGSTFNPDQPTGIEIFLIPGVRGLPEPISAELEVPGLPGLGAGNVTVKITMLPIEDALHETHYKGSGADYLVNMALDHDQDEDADDIISRLNLYVKTGGDNLREGSQLSATVSFCEGGELQTQTYNNINGGADRPNWDDSYYSLPMFGVRVKDVKQLALEWVPDSDFFGDDDWDVEVVKFGYNRLDIEGTYFVRHGRPLMRFTDTRRRWAYRFDSARCES